MRTMERGNAHRLALLPARKLGPLCQGRPGSRISRKATGPRGLYGRACGVCASCKAVESSQSASNFRRSLTTPRTKFSAVSPRGYSEGIVVDDAFYCGYPRAGPAGTAPCFAPAFPPTRPCITGKVARDKKWARRARWLGHMGLKVRPRARRAHVLFTTSPNKTAERSIGADEV